MGTERTAWHVLFAALIQERAPTAIEVRPEVPLSAEPQRGDLLLLRRRGQPRDDDHAQVLRDLWNRLPAHTLAEYKSPRHPFAAGGLVRLLGYGCQYHVATLARRDDLGPPLTQLTDLALVLLVPDYNHALHAEIAMLGLNPRPLADGYWQLLNIGLYPLYLVLLDVVAATEPDELLGVFGRAGVHSRAARWWLERHVSHPGVPMTIENIADLPDYDDVLAKIFASVPPEQRLAGLTPEQRLAGLTPAQILRALPPAQILAGLPPEQAVLALPDSLLRGLADDYVAGLPVDVRTAIRKRLGR